MSQSSHGGFSIALNNLCRQYWTGTISGLHGESCTLHLDVSSLLEDLTQYLGFRNSVDNKFRNVLGRLETLDAALQASVSAKEEP